MRRKRSWAGDCTSPCRGQPTSLQVEWAWIAVRTHTTSKPTPKTREHATATRPAGRRRAAGHTQGMHPAEPVNRSTAHRGSARNAGSKVPRTTVGDSTCTGTWHCFPMDCRASRQSEQVLMEQPPEMPARAAAAAVATPEMPVDACRPRLAPGAQQLPSAGSIRPVHFNPPAWPPPPAGRQSSKTNRSEHELAPTRLATSSSRSPRVLSGTTPAGKWRGRKEQSVEQANGGEGKSSPWSRQARTERMRAGTASHASGVW